jgi:transposase
MSRIGFTDGQWAFICPLLPPPARTGRPRADDRRTIEGILYVLITGCRWQDLPREYGAPTTVWRRLKRWGKAGAWERIWRWAISALATPLTATIYREQLQRVPPLDRTLSWQRQPGWLE